MKPLRIAAFTFIGLAIFGGLALAQDPAPKAKTTPPTDARPARPGATTLAPSQAESASKTAKFGKIAKTDEACRTALDAHALDDALKLVDKDGAFKGTVTKVFEPRSGAMAILNFDEQYQTALTAMLRKENFDKFPALTNLLGKDVLITGKFAKFQTRVEIVLTNAAQIKLVE
jgi:hypothetical protein